VSAQPLPGVLAYLAPVLTNYGYFAIGGFITLEDFGVPVPGETILIAAAVYAGAGKLNVVAVGVIAVLAAIIGDNIGYTIGHFGGRALVLRFGKYVLLTSERLDKAERFFDHYGSLVVTFARFVEGLRQANGIVAGTIRMHWLRFLIFNALGAVLWVGLWTSVGYLAGDHITAIYDTITRYSLYVLIALGVAVAALIVRAVLRRRRRIAAAAVADGDAPAEDGAAEDSASEDRAAEDRAAEDNAAEDSAAEDSAPQDKAAEAAPPAQKPTTRPD
jgi:membrane protein DedA with SNARE-associated domain